MTISVDEQIRVSGLMQQPASAKTCLVLAHGAGAGMNHPFMAALAADLAAIGIATLRFQFPYMEDHGKRPDPPALCHATIRAVVAKAHELAPALPLLAGGKSYETPEGPKDFNTRTETISVRFGEPVQMTVRETRHGPVLSDVLRAGRVPAALAESDKVLALSATLLQPNDHTGEALYRMASARRRG